VLRLRQVRWLCQRNIRNINPLQKLEGAGFSRGNQPSPNPPNARLNHAWGRRRHHGPILIVERRDQGFIDHQFAWLPIFRRAVVRYEQHGRTPRLPSARVCSSSYDAGGDQF
jgi:hypothetical protein